MFNQFRGPWIAFVLLFLIPEALGSELSYRVGLDSFIYGEDNSVEPGFSLPAQGATLDARVNMKLGLGEWFRVTAVPRWVGAVTQVDSDQETSSRFSFNELTVSFSPSDHLSLHFGKESYQWGPAEFLSPSNPIFHYTLESRSVVFLEEGKWLARANLSAGKNFSAVLLGETTENEDPRWSLDRPTERKILLKLEYRLDNGSTYAGLTGGMAEARRRFVGEYGNFSLNDVFSFYFDARQTQGNDAYYPILVNAGTVDLQVRSDTRDAVETLALVGVRAETDVDVRLEYVYNQAGYTDSEYLQALNSTNVPRLLATGLEVVGIHTVYASLRKSDLGAERLYTLNGRYAHFLADHSGMVFGSVERLFGDHAVGFIEGSYFHGGSYSEAGMFYTSSFRLGARLSL